VLVFCVCRCEDKRHQKLHCKDKRHQDFAVFFACAGVETNGIKHFIVKINGTKNFIVFFACAGVKTNGTKNFIVIDGSMSALIRFVGCLTYSCMGVFALKCT